MIYYILYVSIGGEMDLGITLIALIIFGVFGFIISKIWGINPYRIFSDISAAVIIIAMFAIIFPSIQDPNKAIDTIPALVNYFGAALPGIVIGDIAGSFVSAVTD